MASKGLIPLSSMTSNDINDGPFRPDSLYIGEILVCFQKVRPERVKKVLLLDFFRCELNLPIKAKILPFHN